MTSFVQYHRHLRQERISLVTVSPIMKAKLDIPPLHELHE